MKDINVNNILGTVLQGNCSLLTTSIKVVFAVSFAILGHWLGTKLNEDYVRWDNQFKS